MTSRDRYAVIIGETGSGKSTFINYAANYFNKGTLQRPWIAIPTTYKRANMNYAYNEHSIDDRTKSKTVDCQRYTFRLDDIRFNFIDTPGVNDTGGLTQDSQNVDKVFSYIENISELSALILILNGAVARITINIKNVLAIYRDRLPDAIYLNTIVILTNCEEHTVNFSPASVDLSEQCSIFYMQNSAFSSDPSTWSSGAMNLLQRHFDLSMRTVDRIVTKLLSLKPVSTKLFKDVSDDRNQIKQRLHMARMTIFDLQNLTDELAAFELSADIYAANAEKFRNFTRERRIVQNHRIETKYYNTLCINCGIVCHEECNRREVYAAGSASLFQCLAINQNGRCDVCPNHCKRSDHFHARYIIQKSASTVVEIVDGMQQRYLQARDGQKAADSKCNDLQTSKRFLESALQQQYKEVKESVRNLQETCKDANITAILFQFTELLEKDASTLKSRSVIERSHEFITNLKQLCSESERLNDTQRVIQPQSSDQNMRRKSIQYSNSRNDKDLSTSSEAKVHDISYRHNVGELSSPRALYSPLPIEHRPQPIAKHGRNDSIDVFHDACTNELDTNNQKPIDHVSGLKRSENLQLRQDTTNGQLNFKHERERENISMLPSAELLRLSNTGVNDSTYDDIKTELQHRCNGESIGFLTFSEQLVLCEEYVKYQHITSVDLMRICLKLIDEIKEITGGDPFRIHLVPLEKRLQLSAINLRIKKRNECKQ